jgi:DNA-binding GntR family transcriptional regulator
VPPEAFEAVVAAHESGDAEQVLNVKTSFYKVLHEGTNSETLTSMLTTLHARIWQWRSLGLTHPKRSNECSSESVENLRSIVTAAENGNADAAESATREEANQAAQEVMRLLAVDTRAILIQPIGGIAGEHSATTSSQ